MCEICDCCFQEKFVLTDYMQAQPDLNASMRGILIDWMVEVQVTSCHVDFCLGNIPILLSYLSVNVICGWVMTCLISRVISAMRVRVLIITESQNVIIFTSPQCRKILSWIMKPCTWRWSWRITTCPSRRWWENRFSSSDPRRCSSLPSLK